MFKRPDTPRKPGSSPLEVTSLKQVQVNNDVSKRSKAVKSAPPKFYDTNKDPEKQSLPRKRAKKPTNINGELPTPKAMTAKRINNIVQYYLTQREACSGMVRQMLHRRAFQWLASIPESDRYQIEEQFKSDTEECLEKMISEGLINDERYAEMRAYTWRSQGKGMYKIKMDLLKKEISEEIADIAIRKADEELISSSNIQDEVLDVEGEYASAERLAQKRKIGSYRRSPAPSDRVEFAKLWKREAGILARAGYGLDIIRQVLDREPDTSYEQDF